MNVMCYFCGVKNTMKNILNKEEDNLLQRAMEALDDYLNAGCKETRKKAAENAKEIYKEFYGKDYVNQKDR